MVQLINTSCTVGVLVIVTVVHCVGDTHELYRTCDRDSDRSPCYRGYTSCGAVTEVMVLWIYMSCGAVAGGHGAVDIYELLSSDRGHGAVDTCQNSGDFSTISQGSSPTIHHHML